MHNSRTGTHSAVMPVTK